MILRSPYVGNQWMSRSQYKQMIGRAGRAGIDTSGESILIIGNKDRTKLNLLIRGVMGTCRSNLMYEKGKGLRELILSLLGLNVNIPFYCFYNCLCSDLQLRKERKNYFHFNPILLYSSLRSLDSSNRSHFQFFL